MPRALQTAPFEPLQSVELKFIPMKSLLLTTLASIKRVGYPQPKTKKIWVDKSCLEFGPADSSATLRPRPSYVPKVPTTPFRDQVVNLQALPLEEADPALAFSDMYAHCNSTWIELRALATQNTFLSIEEDSRRVRLSPRRGWPTG